MNQDCKHFIFTRFNLPTPNWTHTRDGEKVLTDDWMSDRWQLFEQFTFPSFVNQSNQNFEWFVFFDKSTDDIYWQKIMHLANGYVNFKPVKLENNQAIAPWLYQLSHSINEKTKYLISTNVDNDDMIHKDFVKNIQKLYKPQHDLVIDMVKGYRMKLISSHSGIFQRWDIKCNAFVSLVEKKTDFKSIYKEKHLSYRNYKNYIGYDKNTMHIQIVHQFNKLNQYSSNRALLDVNLAPFGVRSSDFSIDLLASLKYNLMWMFKKFKSLLNK